MPSEHQQSNSTGEYANEACRMIDTKPDCVLLNIKPMLEANAREWVGACTKYNASEEVTEHFVSEVKRLKED